jgi:hypothetical protein
VGLPARRGRGLGPVAHDGDALDHALAAGVGYTVSLSGGLHLYAGYDVIWNPDVLEHGFGGGIQFAW